MRSIALVGLLGLVALPAQPWAATAAHPRARHPHIRHAVRDSVKSARADSAAAIEPPDPPLTWKADSASAPYASRAWPPDALWSWADSVSHHLSTLRRVHGRTDMGDVISLWSAYSRAGRMVYVIERVDHPIYGGRENEFWFADDSLRVFRSRGEHSWTDPHETRPGPYEVRFTFGPGGVVRSSKKYLGAELSKIEEAEAVGAQSRAEYMRYLATHAVRTPARP